MKKASVIIPVYNREHLIERCLDSVNVQKYRPLEVIVVDNNSTDNSLATAENWIRANGDPQIEWHVCCCREQGAAAARAHGEAHSSGEYLFFFDSDDVMRPGYVDFPMERFLSDSNLDVVGWRIKMHGSGNNVRITHGWEAPDSMAQHLVNAVLRTQGYAVRKNTLRRAGGWKKDIKVWDDWELGIRILLMEPKMEVVNSVLADTYFQEESITGTGFGVKIGEWEKILDIAQKEILESNHPEKIHFARIVDYRRAILAAHYYREGYKDHAKRLYSRDLSSILFKYQGRLALKLAYHYTKAGGRGAFHFVRHLL